MMKDWLRINTGSDGPDSRQQTLRHETEEPFEFCLINLGDAESQSKGSVHSRHRFVMNLLVSKEESKSWPWIYASADFVFD